VTSVAGAGRAYLDHNATAPLLPAVRDAMLAALDLLGNPSSVHAEGRAARRAVEAARAAVAALAGAPPAGVVLTAGGTEANNLALRGLGLPALVSAVEHDSVLRAAPEAARVPVDARGVLDLGALDRMLAGAGGPALVSVMLVNNETGIVQPVAEAARIARARGALVHCDAVQAAGRLPLDMAALGVDMLTLSAHKLGGPKGCGALVLGERPLRDGPGLKPLLLGGGQERRLRAGTENVAGAVGFGRAAELAAEGIGDQPRLAALRDRMEAMLRDAAPGLPLYGAGAARVANTSCFGMPGVPSEVQVMALDLAGVAVGAGSACSSGKVTPSHVLAAMGVPAAEAGSAIRVSLGRGTGEGEIARLVAAWSALRARRAGGRVPVGAPGG
jgi:cysteine desulfurase